MDYLDTIHVFVSVVDKGNFTRAAEAQGTTASYVSKAMSSLERRLSCKLFQRSTRHIQMTQAGEVFYDHAVGLIERFSIAENAVHDLVDKPQGRLRISGPSSLGSFLDGGGVVHSFLQKYPQIEVDLELDNRKIDMVLDGFDLCLRVAIALPDSSLVARPINTFKMIICCAPDYIDQYGKPRRVSDLINHNCLIFKPATFNNTWMLKKDGKTVVIPVRGNLSSNNVDVIKNSAVSGAGVTVLPENYIVDELKSGQLLRLFPSYGSRELTLYAVYPDRQWIPKKTSLFIEHLKASAYNYGA